MSDGRNHLGETTDEAPTEHAPSQVQSEVSCSKPALWVELGVVLLLAVVPDLFQSFYAYFQPSTESSSFWYQCIWMMCRSAQVSAPLLLILWLKRVEWAQFGMPRFRLLVDIPLAPLATLAVWLAWWAFWAALAFLSVAAGDDSVFGLADPGANPEPDDWYYYSNAFGGYAVLTLAELANGFAEELVMRAYLITRLTTLLGSPLQALFFSTALFALYHCYQGPIGVIGAGVTGLVFGMLFLWMRRLWPIALAHAASNLLFAMGI